MKLKADHIFAKEFSSIEEESSVIAEFIPKNENDYTIKCKILDNNETIYLLLLCVVYLLPIDHLSNYRPQRNTTENVTENKI